MRDAHDTHVTERLNGDAIPLAPPARVLATRAPAPGERTIAAHDGSGLTSRAAPRVQDEIDTRRRRRRSWLVLIEIMLVLGVLAVANLLTWELLRRGW